MVLLFGGLLVGADGVGPDGSRLESLAEMEESVFAVWSDKDCTALVLNRLRPPWSTPRVRESFIVDRGDIVLEDDLSK